MMRMGLRMMNNLSMTRLIRPSTFLRFQLRRTFRILRKFRTYKLSLPRRLSMKQPSPQRIRLKKTCPHRPHRRLPTPMPKQEERTPQAKEPSPRPNPISPRSKKIKGLNSRQTVIVVKSAGIFSKLYTISLVFLILAVVSYLVAFALVTFSPEEVGPKLERMGISLKWFGHEGASGDSSPPSEPSSPVPSGPSDTGGGTNNSPTE